MAKTYTIETNITVNKDGINVTVQEAKLKAATEGESIPFDRLQALYQEVGQHERHYSSVRMAATSLLFTLAILTAGFFWESMTEPDRVLRTALLYAAIPGAIFLLSLAVNFFYGRISADARILESHLENLMGLDLKGVPHALREPHALFLRAFERHQKRSDTKYDKDEAPQKDCAAFVRRFEEAIGQGKRLRRSFPDGPFYLVGVAIALYFLAVLCFVIIGT